MSIAKKILGNTAIQILGKVLSACIALVTVKILSGYFSIAQLGNYGITFEYLALFGALADMGVYTFVLREISKEKNENSQKKLYNTALGLRIFLIASSMILATFCGAFFFWGTSIPVAIAIAAVGTFFVILSGTVSVILQYKMQMQYYSYALILGKIIGFLGIVFLIHFFFPTADQTAFYAIILSGTIGSFFIYLFTQIWSWKHIAPNPNWNREDLKTMLKNSIPFGIAMILATLYFRSGFLLLEFLLPESVEDTCKVEFCGDLETGKYYIAIRMMEVLLLFPIYFMNSLMPYLAKNIAEQSKRLPQVFSLSFLFVLIMTLPISIGGVMLSTELSALMADEKLLATATSNGSDTGFFLLSIALFFAFLTTFFTFSLIALNKQKLVVWVNLGAVIANIFLNILLIPHYGLLGAGISTIICEVVLVLVFFVLLQKSSAFPVLWYKVGKVFFAGGLMAMGLYFLQIFFSGNAVVFLSILLAPIIYFGSMWLFGIRVQELRKILAS